MNEYEDQHYWWSIWGTLNALHGDVSVQITYIPDRVEGYINDKRADGHCAYVTVHGSNLYDPFHRLADGRGSEA